MLRQTQHITGFHTDLITHENGYWQCHVFDAHGYKTMWCDSDGSFQAFSRVLSSDPKKLGRIDENFDTNIIFSTIPNHRIQWSYLGASPIHMIWLYLFLMGHCLSIWSELHAEVAGNDSN